MFHPRMKWKLPLDHFEYPEMIAKDVLGNCEYFREEISAMKDLIQSYGNIVLFSAKGHPEIAGSGIEYYWVVSKKCFHRDNNHVSNNCENNVLLSLYNVTLQFKKNTTSKARYYIHSYKKKF